MRRRMHSRLISYIYYNLNILLIFKVNDIFLSDKSDLQFKNKFSEYYHRPNSNLKSFLFESLIRRKARAPPTPFVSFSLPRADNLESHQSASPSHASSLLQLKNTRTCAIRYIPIPFPSFLIAIWQELVDQEHVTLASSVQPPHC